QLNQEFLNLLNNAIDALEERDSDNKNIRINTETVLLTHEGAANPAVLVTIADNGMGMTPEIQDRSLNPFFTTKPVGKGTGLGLPICYQIVVEQHHGELEIQSQPGEGTTVKVTLPIAPPALRCDLPLSFATLTTDSPPA
ncbi:MAG: hypothetical protein F6J87_06390, partial [Spirulina sp. SIO3F2]|nr:hypothetical protein [Spirulina sp. SIO3F2]